MLNNATRTRQPMYLLARPSKCRHIRRFQQITQRSHDQSVPARDVHFSSDADPATPSSNRTQSLIQFFWKGVAKMQQTRRRAFTLIELIVVIVVIALVLAVVLPAIQQQRG